MSWSGLAWLALYLSVASSRRPEDLKSSVMVIEEDKLFSVFLYPGQAASFFFLLQRDEVPILSFTVTPCTAPIAWDISYRNSSETGKVNFDGKVTLPSAHGPQVRVLKPAFQGLYTIQLSVQEESWIQLFVTYLNHPQKLRPTTKLNLLNKRMQGQVFVKWQQTTVDPDETVYVLVIHRGKRPLESLCKAVGELEGVQKPKDWTPPQGYPKSPPHPQRHDIVMERVGKRTSWVVHGLEPKEFYQLELFAINTMTNFSYRYASASNVTYRRPKPVPLQDGKMAVADLRRSEPRAAFRFKVRDAGSSALEVGVTACGSGGSVLAEVRQRASAVGDKATINGHSKLSVYAPQQGAVFIIRLRLPPGARNTQVQVTATIKGLEDPVLPELAVVHEYKGLRGCNQLTLGWVPVIGEALYCITATQVRRKDPFYRFPDQCSVEQALNSLVYSVLQCTQILPAENQTVITEPIANLKAGKQYDIQVSVKKGNSKVLSYELIRVRTKKSCK